MLDLGSEDENRVNRVFCNRPTLNQLVLTVHLSIMCLGTKLELKQFRNVSAIQMLGYVISSIKSDRNRVVLKRENVLLLNLATETKISPI